LTEKGTIQLDNDTAMAVRRYGTKIKRALYSMILDGEERFPMMRLKIVDDPSVLVPLAGFVIMLGGEDVGDTQQQWPKGPATGELARPLPVR
jgi:hypothetical protein